MYTLHTYIYTQIYIHIYIHTYTYITGVMSAATPTGCLRTYILRSFTVDGIISPYIRLPSSANHSMKEAP